MHGAQHCIFHPARITRLKKLQLPEHTGVVACKVFEPELKALGINDAQVVYIEQNLHREPDSLQKMLAETICHLEDQAWFDTVVLLYGYCGGGMEGLRSNRLRLIIPLAHDCVPVLVGTKKDQDSNIISADFFYLSPGWIDHGLTPYSEYFVSCEKYGHEDALWISREMLKSYSSVMLVENLARLSKRHRRYAREMARMFELDYRECQGESDWLVRLLEGQESDEVAVIEPGTVITLKCYPMGTSLTRAQSG